MCIPTTRRMRAGALFDHGWYRAISRDDVELVEGACRGPRQHADHRRRPGVRGRRAGARDRLPDARPARLGAAARPLGRTLRETWGEEEARAYLGITVPDFPNLFILFGPNTNTGHGGSAFLTLEMQVRYTIKLIAAMVERRLTSVEVRREVYDRYAGARSTQRCQRPFTLTRRRTATTGTRMAGSSARAPGRISTTGAGPHDPPRPLGIQCRLERPPTGSQPT